MTIIAQKDKREEGAMLEQNSFHWNLVSINLKQSILN